MTSPQKVDYDSIASTYHGRYQAEPLAGIAALLVGLARRIQARRILEAGCGTGRWLGEFQSFGAPVIGLDLSFGMLRQAQAAGAFSLVCAQAEMLPFPASTFDLIACVNAFHHFSDKPGFVHAAYRRLRPGGALAIIGMDPHRGVDRWGVYDYFEGTLRLDLERFPAHQTILSWMSEAGFRKVEWQVAEHIQDNRSGPSILESHFLGKNGTSQLVLLSDEAYQNGLAKINRALEDASRAGRELVFPTEIDLVLALGWA